jgi:parvulin-like peptidyl-prolyl isomerase
VLLAATLVAALLLSACGSTTEPDAATVGKTSISRGQLDDELKVIAGNKALAKQLKTQNIELTPSSGGISAAVTTGWLTSLVNQVFVDKVFNEKQLKVSAENKTAAKTAAEAIFINAKIFGQFPKSFRDKVISRQERIEAVKSSLPQASSATDAQLQQFFETTKAQFCPSGTVVAHILVKTKAEADAVEAALAQGTDFATLAAQKSTDTGSASRGGLVACTDTQQFTQLAASFRTAATATPVGSVSAPVQTEFGYHVIKVAPWDFATARPVIQEAYAQQQGQDSPLTAFLNQKLKSSKLWVDPRYGTVKRTAAGVAIAPPKTPKPKTRPTTTTTVAPTGQAPTGQAPTGQGSTSPSSTPAP